MYIPVWLFFFLPGVSDGLAAATPWFLALAVLWCLGWLAVRCGSWVMDDTWKTRRDAARQAAAVASRRMPTSRRALTASRPGVAP